MIVLYIILALLALLLLIIGVALLLPLKLIITYTEEVGLDFRIKILFYTFGDDESEDILPKIFDNFTKKSDSKHKVKKDSVSEKGLSFTVKEVFELVKSVLSHVMPFLKSFVVTKLELNIICADAEDTAKAATDYGKVCAIVYPVLGFIHSNLKVKKRKERISISCDYLADKPAFTLNTILSVRIIHILSAFLPAIKVLLKQLISKNGNNQKSIENKG